MVNWLGVWAITLALCVPTCIAHGQSEEGGECSVTVPRRDATYGDKYLGVLLWSTAYLNTLMEAADTGCLTVRCA